MSYESIVSTWFEGFLKDTTDVAADVTLTQNQHSFSVRGIYITLNPLSF